MCREDITAALIFEQRFEGESKPVNVEGETEEMAEVQGKHLT